MSAWTLIAHPDPDIREEIERTVREVTKSWAGNIVQASHAEAARAALFSNGASDCRMIVVGVALPKDAATPLRESDGSHGIDLVRALRSQRLTMPAVFTAEHADSGLYQAMRALPPSRFVRLGPDWGADLALQLSDIPLGAHTTRYRRGLNLDMRLLKQWSWQLDGEGVEDGGEIYRNESILEEIQSLSGAIARDRSGQTWPTLLNSIRKQLNELFFRATLNEKFNSGLLLNIGRFGARNARVRFTVDEATHDLFLEALQDPENSRSFWMLKAPIYRRYDRPGKGFALFKDRASRQGKISCLIIAANPAECEALGAPWNTPLEELPKLMPEVEAIQRVLEDEMARPGGCIGKVEVFRAVDHPGAAEDALERVLQQETWHLVHFVGHAVRSGSDGALVLDGAQGAVLSADRLAGQLAEAQTQFLYLSSCKSADAYFVMRLVDKSLPAVLGYRWPVQDDKAFAFARYFYKALFEDEESRKYLEYALLNAKCKLHDDSTGNASDPTWAAPVLVMQVDRAQDDAQMYAAVSGAAESASRPAWH
jgi:hypothetical protein